jgi:uncharacterized membrane protein YkvA (DUF1232 family)
MSDPSNDARYLELFPSWLRTLGEDAAALGELIKGDASQPVKEYVAGGLNYIFKSLDLIPDGIDDLGFLDDAFVLRVSALLAVTETPAANEGALARLAADATALKEFLGEDYVRLEGYTRNLRKGAARGRTVQDILTDAAVRTEFVHEVAAWSNAFQVPTFTRDPKTLIKLRAFLSAKLP